MSPGSPPAVVLGGSYNAVSVARSLGRSGIEVVALGGSLSPVRYSRHCAEFADLGLDSGAQVRWLEWLEQGPRGAVVLPCDDDGLELIAHNRTTLTDWGYIPFEARDDVLLAMLDKDRTYDLARAHGLAAPRTVAVRDVDDIASASSRIATPCALKPVHSHKFAHQFGRGLKAIEVDTPAELERELEALVAEGIAMLVTEVVPGSEDSFYGYYTYVDDSGEPLFHLTKRKLRQYPPTFGMGCYHVTGWYPEAAEFGQRFVEKAGIRGLANVEMKRDSRDGSMKLIECNHRFTAIHELLRVAGADLARFTYDHMIGRDAAVVGPLREGVRLWHPLKDARAAATLRRRGELSMTAYVRSIAHVQRTPLFDWRDPQPSAVSASHQVRGLLARRGFGKRG